MATVVVAALGAGRPLAVAASGKEVEMRGCQEGEVETVVVVVAAAAKAVAAKAAGAAKAAALVAAVETALVAATVVAATDLVILAMAMAAESGAVGASGEEAKVVVSLVVQVEMGEGKGCRCAYGSRGLAGAPHPSGLSSRVRPTLAQCQQCPLGRRLMVP